MQKEIQFTKKPYFDTKKPCYSEVSQENQEGKVTKKNVQRSIDGLNLGK